MGVADIRDFPIWRFLCQLKTGLRNRHPSSSLCTYLITLALVLISDEVYPHIASNRPHSFSTFFSPNFHVHNAVAPREISIFYVKSNNPCELISFNEYLPNPIYIRIAAIR